MKTLWLVEKGPPHDPTGHVGIYETEQEALNACSGFRHKDGWASIQEVPVGSLYDIWDWEDTGREELKEYELSPDNAMFTRL